MLRLCESTKPFYIRDLSILRFWYWREVLGPICSRYQGTTVHIHFEYSHAQEIFIGEVWQSPTDMAASNKALAKLAGVLSQAVHVVVWNQLVRQEQSPMKLSKSQWLWSCHSAHSVSCFIRFKDSFDGSTQHNE